MSGKKKRASKKSEVDRATGRYTAKEKAEMLRQLDGGRTYAEVAKQYGVSTASLHRWLKQRQAARQTGDRSGLSGLRARSTRPVHSPSALTAEQRNRVLEVKKEHPEMGPAQIRNQLRRFHGLSLSHKTIGKVLKDAGYQLEKRASDEEESAVGRFEMSRPGELWTMDTKSFYVHDLKVYLITVLDDYSRFVVGHGLFREVTAERAIGVLKAAIGRHGKPERVLSDRGPEFHMWNGKSAFTKFLEDEAIEHSLARPYHPQTCGKVEALHATLEKELIGQLRFDSFSDAQRELERYYEHYNFERTHMGIGGVTPADRYFGRAEQVVAAIERSTPAVDRGDQQRLPGERAVVLQLALVEGRLELWFAGKRVALG